MVEEVLVSHLEILEKLSILTSIKCIVKLLKMLEYSIIQTVNMLITIAKT